MRFLPRPIQKPGIPIWVAATYGKTKPLRRAARHDSIFPINLEHPDQLAEMVAEIRSLRQATGHDPTAPYDAAVALPPNHDPQPYENVGATWSLVEFPSDTISVDIVRSVIRDGLRLPT